MPPSHSCKSADENSGGKLLKGRSTKYYIDSDSDNMVSKGDSSKRSHTRSDARPQAPAKQPHAWGGATNLQIEVGDRRFYLEKFPWVSKSGKLNRLLSESSQKDRIVISDIPGGAQAFEFIARDCYGGKLRLSPHNVAAIRCAAEYLELTDEPKKLVTKTEHYLNHVVASSWRDSIMVLKRSSDLTPWAEDLEIVRRCSESIAWKCSTDLHKLGTREATQWFDEVCSLSIDTFSRVIHAVTTKGLQKSSIVATAVQYYAEKWLRLRNGSDMSTTLKLTKEVDSPQAASFMAFTGFNQDIVAKDATKQTQHKNRAVVQGIVNLLPSQLGNSLSVKFLLKLLRVACLVNAGSFCKTDLAKRIASQLERVALDDLLIPASGESTYDVDVVQQIVEFYIENQSYGNSPPLSPRSSISGTTSRTSSSRSLTSSVSSSDLSIPSSVTSVTTGSSRSGRSVSSSGSDSGSSSLRSSDTGSSISGSSISGSLSSSRSSSFRSTASSETTESHASSETTTTSSISGHSSDESVKLETKQKKKPAFYDTETPSRKTLLPPTTANFKVAQLLETYLEEIAKDSSISFGKFLKLGELFTEFPRDSDDSIYRAIDGFLRAHPSLTETERKELCCLMDTGALSLTASVHAASNERLPLRVIVQLLFSEQIKLRNEMTANDVINEKKDLGEELPSFSSATSTTSSTESSSDATSSSLSSGSTSSASSSRSSRSLSISSASALSLAIANPKRTPSVASSPLLGGLSVKETLRFVLAEIESLRKSVQEIEIVKSRLTVMETLQLEMENLSSKFQEMSQDYIGMTQQVEELTKGSKHTKSGWSSGWKKVTKSFQSSHDHKNETPPLPPVKLLPPTDVPALPVLRTSKSDTLQPKTPRSLQTKTQARADSLPVTMATTKSTDSGTTKEESSPVAKTITPKADLTRNPKRGNDAKPGLTPQKKESVETPRDSFKQEVAVKSEKTTPSISKRMPEKDVNKDVKVPVVVKSETTTPSISKRQDVKDVTSETSSGQFKGRGKEDYTITAHRSHHVEDLHRRSVRSRSASPDYVRQHSPRYKGLDSVSVTSTSSYSTTSTTLSGHQYRRRGGGRDGARHYHRSTHKTEKNLGHGRSEEHHGKHRNGHSQNSIDSNPARHSSKEHGTLHSATTQAHSHHHRYKEGSVGSHHTKEGSEHHSGSHRSGHRTKDRHKEQHSHRRHHHHPKENFSDSGASSDSAPRRRHRT